MNKMRNIGQKARKTCKAIFNWMKKNVLLVLRVLFEAVVIILIVILIVVFLVVWRISGISDTLYIGTIGTAVAIGLVGLQLSIQSHRAKTRDKMTRAHNAKVIELLEELVELQRAKNKN